MLTPNIGNSDVWWGGQTNLQGYIVAIYNESGTLIGSYTYDAWGNCTATVESGNTTLENSIVNIYNPFPICVLQSFDISNVRRSEP